MADPYGAGLACGVIADGEDKIELRRVRRGELVPAFRAHARYVEAEPVQNRQGHRMDCALGMAAGTPGAEAAFPQLVHDGFAEDRASTVAGAQEEQVVGLVGVDREIGRAYV